MTQNDRIAFLEAECAKLGIEASELEKQIEELTGEPLFGATVV